jgi:hypothetical protein
MNTALFEPLPKALKSVSGSSVKLATPDAPETKPRPFQHSLTGCVLLVTVGAVPGITITLHCQAPSNALYGKIVRSYDTSTELGQLFQITEEADRSITSLVHRNTPPRTAPPGNDQRCEVERRTVFRID